MMNQVLFANPIASVFVVRNDLTLVMFRSNHYGPLQLTVNVVLTLCQSGVGGAVPHYLFIQA